MWTVLYRVVYKEGHGFRVMKRRLIAHLFKFQKAEKFICFVYEIHLVELSGVDLRLGPEGSRSEVKKGVQVRSFTMCKDWYMDDWIVGKVCKHS